MAVDYWLQRLESNQHNTAYEAVETPFLNSAVTSASILHREHRPYKTDVSIQDTSFCGLGSLETHGAAHRSRTCRSLRFAPDCLLHLPDFSGKSEEESFHGSSLPTSLCYYCTTNFFPVHIIFSDFAKIFGNHVQKFPSVPRISRLSCINWIWLLIANIAPYSISVLLRDFL